MANFGAEIFDDFLRYLHVCHDFLFLDHDWNVSGRFADLLWFCEVVLRDDFAMLGAFNADSKSSSLYYRSDWVCTDFVPANFTTQLSIHLWVELIMVVVFIVVEARTMGYMEDALQRVRSVADYQFGRGVGKRLFPADVEIQFSRATGRIRFVNLNGERLATLRPTDGLLCLSILAARRLVESSDSVGCIVIVRGDVASFVAEGSDVFAAHVVKVDDAVHAKDEVIVVDESRQVVGIGRAMLSGSEMQAFKTGVAVKVRHGLEEQG